jgi:integrase
MRVNLNHVHKTSKTRADGSRVDYYYAWRGGPRLDGLPGEPAFLASYERAYQALRKPPQGVLFTLIYDWKVSAEFANLSEASRRNYQRYIRLIEDKFGSMPLPVLDDPRIRGEFKAWRNSMALTPRTADYAWTTLARILAFAKDNGQIRHNPCERGGRLYSGGRADHVWSDDDIARFNAVASPELTLALLMALWTGQRQGDLLRLTWTAFDGKRIRLRQSKTGRSVVVPVGTPLRLALERTPRRATTILTNSDGLPWTADGFRSSWGKTFKRSGIEADLHFHDLRGTAITRIAGADCSVPIIASITGHSLANVTAILDRHYFTPDLKAATAGIRRLETRTKSANRQQTAKPNDVGN